MNTTQSMKSKKIDILPVIFIATAPILSPYALAGSLSLTLIFGLACALIYFVFYKPSLLVESKHYLFIVMLVVLILLSFNGFFVLNELAALANSLLVLVIVFLCYMLSWRMVKFDSVVKVSTVIAWVSVFFAGYQWLVTIRGGVAPLGQLPFFDLTTGWVPEHWGFRFNSFFSEPSYFALYLLPLFAYHLKKNSFVHTFVMAVGIVLSSSSLGALGMILVVLCNLLFDARYRVRTIMAVAALSLILGVIYTSLPAVQTVVGRTVQKILSIEDNSLRVVGYLDYYQMYSPKEMLFGVGMNQFQNYMGQRGIFVYNYSNTVVYMLLQSGLLGLLTMLGYFGWLAKYAVKNKSVAFALICVLLLAFDYAMFSHRFYFLLYFVLYYSEKGRKDPCDEGLVCNTYCN